MHLGTYVPMHLGTLYNLVMHQFDFYLVRHDGVLLTLN